MSEKTYNLEITFRVANDVDIAFLALDMYRLSDHLRSTVYITDLGQMISFLRIMKDYDKIAIRFAPNVGSTLANMIKTRIAEEITL